MPDDKPEQTRTLVLHIAVPGVWVDDLDEMATDCYEGDYFDAVTDSDGMGLDEQVALMVVVRGDEDGPMTFGYTGRVVAVEVHDRTPADEHTR